MASVAKTINPGKEISEIADFIHDLILDIRAGKDVTAISAENLAGLMSAIAGWDQLGTEAKENLVDSVAYIGKMVADSLMEEVAVPVPPAA